MVLLFAAGILLACSKPTDTIIPSDMSKWDSELAPAINKLSEEDKKLATGYLMRAKMGELFKTFSHDAALLEMQAAVNAAAAGGKVGVTGYCFGGANTWRSAACSRCVAV